MADYRVDLTGLQQLIDATTKLESSIEARITAIEKCVADLHMDWSGEAATAHRSAHDDRVAAAAIMRQALRALREKLSAAHTAYGTVGSTNASMWP